MVPALAGDMQARPRRLGAPVSARVLVLVLVLVGCVGNVVQEETEADPVCEAEACAAAGAVCGVVEAECGASSAAFCGACPKPQACGGGGIEHKCGSTCESNFEQECSAAGLPSVWGYLGSCPPDSVYSWQGGTVMYCTSCAEGCEELTISGTVIRCCP